MGPDVVVVCRSCGCSAGFVAFRKNNILQPALCVEERSLALCRLDVSIWNKNVPKILK